SVTLEAVNTLRGGYIELIPHLAGDTTLHVAVNDTLRSLDGRILQQPVSFSFPYRDAMPLHIERVANAASDRPFVHAEGGEHVVIHGSGFGHNAAALSVQVGQTQLGAEAIVQVSDSQIELELPPLHLGAQSLAATVTVRRDTVHARLDGALVIVPRLEIVSINPHTGPPKGGNWLEIVGRGFHSGVVVTVGGRQAGNLELLSANRLRVRVPGGAFGYAQVAVESAFFDDERAYSPQDYFYAGSATGTTALPDDRPSPVAAIAAGEQLIYAVTGGSYDIEDQDGRVLRRLNSAVARLIVV